MKLHKLLAEAIRCSRREAEVCIARGDVRVNGRVVDALGLLIDPARDRVEWRGERVRVMRAGAPMRVRSSRSTSRSPAVGARHRVSPHTPPKSPLPRNVIAFYKPKGVVSTRRDPQGRRTIYDLIPARFALWHAAGRLDYESEGLMLLCEQPAFVDVLTHPKFGVRKTYLVKLDAKLSDAALQRLTTGITEDGETLRAAAIRHTPRVRGEHPWYEVTLVEGKNREIRRLMRAVDHAVLKLKRVQFGPIRLGTLSAGKWRKLNGAEFASVQSTNNATARLTAPPPSRRHCTSTAG